MSKFYRSPTWKLAYRHCIEHNNWSGKFLFHFIPLFCDPPAANTQHCLLPYSTKKLGNLKFLLFFFCRRMVRLMICCSWKNNNAKQKKKWPLLGVCCGWCCPLFLVSRRPPVRCPRSISLVLCCLFSHSLSLYHPYPYLLYLYLDQSVLYHPFETQVTADNGTPRAQSKPSSDDSFRHSYLYLEGCESYNMIQIKCTWCTD